MSKKIKLTLVDDHPLHLEGLKLLLSSDPLLDIVGAFKDSASFLSFAKQNTFDIVLLDFHLPDKNGLEIAGELQTMQHAAKIIMLTMQRGGRLKQKIEKLNIKGYLLKNTDIETIKKTISVVINGGEVFDETKNSHEDDLSLKSSVVIEDKPDNILSEREKEILVLVCQELSSAQIAEKLFISTGTVDTHRKNILVKLNVSNTVGLVKYALKNNLI